MFLIVVVLEPSQHCWNHKWLELCWWSMTWPQPCLNTLMRWCYRTPPFSSLTPSHQDSCTMCYTALSRDLGSWSSFDIWQTPSTAPDIGLYYWPSKEIRSVDKCVTHLISEHFLAPNKIFVMFIIWVKVIWLILQEVLNASSYPSTYLLSPASVVITVSIPAK